MRKLGQVGQALAVTVSFTAVGFLLARSLPAQAPPAAPLQAAAAAQWRPLTPNIRMICSPQGVTIFAPAGEVETRKGMFPGEQMITITYPAPTIPTVPGAPQKAPGSP